ncbi:MAG TPA: phosphopantetheine-binding protein [Bacillota bacterium]
MTDYSKPYEAEVYQKLIQILREVAPFKVVGEITPTTSLVDDFGFDSIDMMDLLLKIKEVFGADKPEIIDVDSFVSCAYNSTDGKPVMVRTICQIILENLYQKVG